MQEKILMPEGVKMLMLLKSLPIRYEIWQEDNGEWGCFVNEGIVTHGTGASYDECRLDLVRGMKEIADIYYEHPEYINKNDGLLILHILKCLNSTEEELISCLAGQS